MLEKSSKYKVQIVSLRKLLSLFQMLLILNSVTLQ